jgi:hypothetical protein
MPRVLGLDLDLPLLVRNPRIAANEDEFVLYVCKLVVERPADAKWPAITDEQILTKH